MNLLVFWALACYLLGYSAFFVTMFPISEKLLATSGYNAKTYWLSLLWTTALSLLWPVHLIRYWRRRART